MYCQYCGNLLKGTEHFCPRCGRAVSYYSFTPAPPADTATPAPQAEENKNLTEKTIGERASEQLSVGKSATEQLFPADEQMSANDNSFSRSSSLDATPDESTQPTATTRPQEGFCARCGQKLNLNDLTCSFCGAPVNKNAGFAYKPAYTPQPNYTAPSGANTNNTLQPNYTAPQPIKEKKGTGIGAAAVALSFLTLVIPLFCFISIALGISATIQGSNTKNKAASVLGIIAIILSFVFFIGLIVYNTINPPEEEYFRFIASVVLNLP